MIVIKAITFGLILFASESLANICTGRWNGDQLPNPSDCGSFYVCNFGEPKLFKCLDNLLYDPLKRVCNWAYLVTCGQISTQEHVQILPNPPYYPQPQPEDGSEGSIYTGSQQQPASPYYPTSAPSYTANPPPLVDNPNIPDYSPTSEVYPGLVESIPNVFHCSNPEFYFAPHPRSCEKYFICENYRIHSHQCGDGIHWDYIFNQCDFPARTFCFAAPHSNTEGVSIDHIEHIIIDPEHIEEHREEQVEEHIEEQVEEHIEEHIDEHIEEHIDEPIEEHVEEPIEGHIEFTTGGVTGPIAITSIEPPLELSTVAPAPIIECPGSQAFIAHPGDCHKYYICIGGIPIVTSCPQKMAWDKNLAQCNEEAWSQCFI